MLLLIWLLVGLSRGDEFGELHIFLKHRPTFQVYFVSPLGMADMPANFSAELATKEALYTEYVRTKHWSSHGFYSFMAQLFILATPIVLGIGVYKAIRNK